jgi:hypothetical protein
MLKRHNTTTNLDQPVICWHEGWSVKKQKRIAAVLKKLQQLKKQLHLVLKG